MLHQVNLPGCVPQLKKIVEFQREVLQYACEGKFQIPLVEADLKALFGDNKGSWLWGKLWTQPKKKNGILPPKKESTLHLSIQKLAEYYQQNTKEGVATLVAFDNDILFADHLNDPNFRFLYPKLTKTNKGLISPLMVSFYVDLLKSGFIEAIHGNPQKLDRDGFIASFWENNKELGVCPACDRERSDKVDKKVFDDADHFLPKSKYPFLSLHPFNLFPLCIYCNRSFKGDRDIVDDQNNAPLTNIFHPYRRTVLEKLDLQVFRDSDGVSKLGEFIDKDGMPSRRMVGFNKVFKLSERWVERLRIQKKNIVEKIIEEGDKLRRREQPDLITKNELEIILQEEQQSTVKKYGKRPGFIVQNSYLTCALSDKGEFQDLFRCFADI